MKIMYIEVPKPTSYGFIYKLWQATRGLVLLPFYLMAAFISKAPGVYLHVKCAILSIRLFVLGRLSFRTCYLLICFPMDSTRYFEHHEVLTALANISFTRLLDVSSPRILPLMLLMRNKSSIAVMINPDINDLENTKQMADALKLSSRCTFDNSTIEMMEYAEGTFDIITCISVLEHIPDDKEALGKMWSLLRSGGRLMLTVPCMQHPIEQYISHNEYGILSSETNGYTFWQRYYDEERLTRSIYCITGSPIRKVIYGERSPGYFFRNATMKRLMSFQYPFWKESYMMAKEYRYYNAISELPGEGVIMLEFIKP